MLYSWVWFVHEFLSKMGYDMTIPQSEVEQYWDLLFDGKKVEAIKLMRSWTKPLTVDYSCFAGFTYKTQSIEDIIRQMTAGFKAPVMNQREMLSLLDSKLFADFVEKNPRIFE